MFDRPNVPEDCKDFECVEKLVREVLGINKPLVIGDAGGKPAKALEKEIVIDTRFLDSFQAEVGGEAKLISSYLVACVLYAIYGKERAIEKAKELWPESLVNLILLTYF